MGKVSYYNHLYSMNIGRLTESLYGYAPKPQKLEHENNKRSSSINQTVDVNGPFVNYIYNEGGQEINNKDQPIAYEEDKQEIENIDDEINILTGIQEWESDDESANKSNTPASQNVDYLFKKSMQISSQVPNQDQSAVEIKAQEIVDQIKELLIDQINISLRDDSQVHYGIQWDECQSIPIKGVRYKCAICVKYNLCEICETSSLHDHLFIKVKNRETRVPIFSEIKRMANKNKPKEEKKKPDHVKLDLPRLSLDLSWAFGEVELPVKTFSDIEKATFIQISDQEFLKTVCIQEIIGEDGIHSDLLIFIYWDLQNESQELWPSNPKSVTLKWLPNDMLIKLEDIPITAASMVPLVIKPNETCTLKLKFTLPHRIRKTAMKNKKTLNLMFSLYDNQTKHFIGSNLPCTIPL
jgi:hypothetical protein